jgi:hypothetical protein
VVDDNLLAHLPRHGTPENQCIPLDRTRGKNATINITAAMHPEYRSHARQLQTENSAGVLSRYDLQKTSMHQVLQDTEILTAHAWMQIPTANVRGKRMLCRYLS